jgi:hypothetical protein
MKKIKNLAVLTLLVGIFWVSFSQAATSCPNDGEMQYELVNGICIPTAGATGLSDKNIEEVIISVMNWIFRIFSTLAIIAFAISGIQYILSSGNQNVMETAKKNLIYSIIGVVVGLSGLVILMTIDGLLKDNLR